MERCGDDLRNVQRVLMTLIVGLPGFSTAHLAVVCSSVNSAILENG